MKIYEYTQHRSYAVEPNEVNVSKTKELGYGFDDPFWGADMGGGKIWRGFEVFLHKNSKYARHHSFNGVFYVSKKTWKKIAYTPRKKW